MNLLGTERVFSTHITYDVLDLIIDTIWPSEYLSFDNISGIFGIESKVLDSNIHYSNGYRLCHLRKVFSSLFTHVKTSIIKSRRATTLSTEQSNRLIFLFGFKCTRWTKFEGLGSYGLILHLCGLLKGQGGL